MGEIFAACAAANIDTPIYITVQWDERSARDHPEWRVVNATNSYHNALGGDPSALKQPSPAWQTICLNHPAYRDYGLEQARGVATRYPTQGLFFDIVGTHHCVCDACLKRMHAHGLDPLSPADCLTND